MDIRNHFVKLLLENSIAIVRAISSLITYDIKINVLAVNIFYSK